MRAPYTHSREYVELICAGDIRPEPVRWLWPGWLACGKLTLLAGAPGTGKTTLMMGCASIVSRGGHWPDGGMAKAGNVLIWSGEDSPKDTLVPRLIAAGADMRRVFFVGETVMRYGDTRSFDPAEDLASLREAIVGLTANQGLSLLIVDPIVSVVAGDSHKNTEVRRALQPLVDLAEALDCALVGISHFSKGTQGRDQTERVTGSIAFTALARVVLAAAKTQNAEGEPSQILARTKSNIGPDHGGIRYEFEEVELNAYPGVFTTRIRWGERVAGDANQLLAPPPAAEERNSAIDEAKAFLSDLLGDGPIPAPTVYAAANSAGFSKSTIDRAKKRLGIQAQKESMSSGWLWHLP